MLQALLLAVETIGDTPTSGLVGGLVGAAGGVGFAIWYGWYITTHTLPKVVEDGRAEREKIVTEFRTERDSLVTVFREERHLDREELQAFRTLLQTSTMETTRAVDRLTAHIDRLVQSTHATLGTVKGDIGDKGPMGDKGQTGDKGPIGDKGK